MDDEHWMKQLRWPSNTQCIGCANTGSTGAVLFSSGQSPVKRPSCLWRSFRCMVSRKFRRLHMSTWVSFYFEQIHTNPCKQKRTVLSLKFQVFCREPLLNGNSGQNDPIQNESPRTISLQNGTPSSCPGKVDKPQTNIKRNKKTLTK